MNSLSDPFQEIGFSKCTKDWTLGFESRKRDGGGAKQGKGRELVTESTASQMHVFMEGWTVRPEETKLSEKWQ